MTEKDLMKVFAGNGIEKFGEVGDIFDPERYDAMFQYEDPGTSLFFASPGSMVQDSGLNGAVFRSASCVVLPYDVGDRATWSAVVVCAKRLCALPCEYERRRHPEHQVQQSQVYSTVCDHCVYLCWRGHYAKCR